MPIKDWPAGERPREKLLALGPQALSEAELLAVFLRTGIAGRDDHSPLAAGEIGKIGPLVIEASVIEIGKVPEDLDAQPRQRGQGGLEGGSRQRLDRDAHAEGLPLTCTIQSVRL